MEQMNWKEAIPASLLTQWEVNQEMLTWLEETPQIEITTGSTVQRSGQTSDIVTNTSSEEGSETSSRSVHEDTVNTV